MRVDFQSEFFRPDRLFRLASFTQSHRQLLLCSEATTSNRSTKRIEVYFGHVTLMLLKPYYENGVRIRRASDDEFGEMRAQYGLPEDDAPFTWLLEDGGRSFVASSNPSWREAEYPFDGRPLFDFSQPWPRDFPAEWGTVG